MNRTSPHAKKIGVCYAVMILSALLFAGILGAPLPAAADTIVYSEGFEADNGGYAANGDAEWEWGTPVTVGPGMAHSGDFCWGTDLDGTVTRPCEGSIVSPAISLPAITEDQIIRIRFWAYIAVDGMYDRGEFFVSDDGTNWESLCEFFQSMDPTGQTTSAWRKYEFSISNGYAGGNLYLRYRAAVPYSSTSFYCGGSNDLSGVYIDDVAITIYDVPGNKKLFGLEAWEDPSAYASCPWVAPWNGSEFHVDNDIYSVARRKVNEYTDHYKLMQPLVEANGVYPIEIQEREQEDSYTDFVALIQVDHAPDVSVAPDEDGNLIAFRPSGFLAPISAVSGDGENVLLLVSTAEDNKGYPAYSEDTVIVNFGAVDVSQGAQLYLRVAGFILGEGENMPYVGPPAIVVETRDEEGLWQERGRLRPRFAYSVSAFELAPYLSNGEPVEVRLRSISHWTKYHAIDYVALHAAPQPSFTASQVLPTLAIFGEADILPILIAADENYFEMTTGEKFYLEFPIEPLVEGSVREFIFVSRGYYIPRSATYLIYTWDGANWVMRDGYSYPGSDLLKEFDLSLFLPDPDGDFKVRVWQDYQWEPAGIDYVDLWVGENNIPLSTAWDQRSNTNIYNTVINSDDVKTYWSGCPRNRITDYEFVPQGDINSPPTTNPVSVDGMTISWTYNDADEDPQASYEVEVWTGPGASGDVMWDPPVGMGTTGSVPYGGQQLQNGETYYARVKAFDGTDWGGWSEAEWFYQGNLPPVADAGVDLVVTERAKATLDGTGSTDPDDGIASYFWEQIDGIPAVIQDPSAALTSYIVPELDGTTNRLTFQLTVTDFGGLQDQDTVSYEIVEANDPPVADAGPDQRAYEYTDVVLDGSASYDPDGAIVSWQWAQTGGDAVTLSDATVPRPSFEAPAHDPAHPDLTFRLTVTDDVGLQSWDECVVTVRDNFPPDKPVPTAPVDGSTFESGVDIELVGGAYADTEGDAHTGTQWQVRRSDIPVPLIDETTGTDLTEFTVTAGLNPGLQYSWRDRYKDAGSRSFSPWSDELTFTVGNSVQDTSVKVPSGLGVEDYRMVSFTQWPDDPAATSVFGVSPDATKYRIGTYDPLSGDYIELGDPELIVKPGTSYWFLVKGGINPTVEGVPVSLAMDVALEVELLYNSNTGNGWNMIAPPNKADYYWKDVQVVVYDGNGNVISGPTAIGDLAEDNDIIDTRLWRWENGAYYSDTVLMVHNGGYWARAKKANVYLRYPASAQILVSNPVTMFAGLLDEGKRAVVRALSPKPAVAFSIDTPPVPMSGFSSGEGESGSGGSCFISTTLGR